jgi:hypothetical protein
MRAVWSFWSRPYAASTGRSWSSPLHHFLAWGLSVSAAQRHYPDTALVTDEAGKQLLTGMLGLQFATVSTELERLKDADPSWWALGKLVAYSIQDRPFVHIDTDVFLWKPLPLEMADAGVFAQCPEYFHRNSDRGARDITAAFSDSGASLPIEWEWAVSRDDAIVREENCGIVGGCRVDFIRHYARTAADLILRSENADAWRRVAYKSNVAMEQFFLSACVDFHRHHPDSPYQGVRVKYLFPTWDDAVNPNCSTRAGFTHLLGDSKANPHVARRLEERTRREDPEYFHRSQRVARSLN